jgi:hypothetical protein
MKRLFSLALTVAALPAVAQSPPIVGSRARFEAIYACLEQNVSVYDDGISDANVVARALTAMCQNLATDQRSPSTTVMAERNAVQDDAVVYVLKQRAKKRAGP